MLQRLGRVSYRALKRQFALDDAFLEDLKYELTEVQQLAVDHDGTVLGRVDEFEVFPTKSVGYRKTDFSLNASKINGLLLIRQHALETLEALIAERGVEDKIWGSMVKQALKRRQPGFNESYYGFRSFSELLEEAEKRQLLALEHDEKSGGYILRMLAHEG